MEIFLLPANICCFFFFFFFIFKGPRAESLMRAAMEKGQWVFFQNCHLAPSWMPTLERLVEQVDPDHVRRKKCLRTLVEALLSLSLSLFLSCFSFVNVYFLDN